MHDQRPQQVQTSRKAVALFNARMEVDIGNREVQHQAVNLGAKNLNSSKQFAEISVDAIPSAQADVKVRMSGFVDSGLNLRA